MRFFTLVLTCLCLAVPVAGRTQQSPVVVELFTSQGCSACPPADALLARLAGRDDVIALALHVDYWDYLGWADTFGKARHTARQRGYAKMMGNRSVFTPQVIVQGEDMLIGHDAESITQSIAAYQAQPPRMVVRAIREQSRLLISLEPIGLPLGAAKVYVVSYLPNAQVLIDSGENAGKRIKYTNIVTDWSTVAAWDGATDAQLVVEDVGRGPIAVIVQGDHLETVLGAVKVP
jgi:hypothetical protein